MKTAITGIILAGGKSSRMGRDKGFVLYNNQPFITHVLRALTPLVTEVIIVSDSKKYDAFKAKRVNDTIKNSGPLAGLYTGLSASKTTLNIVLSCDIPLITTAALKILIAAFDPKYDVIQLKSNKKTMPLIAIYKTTCATMCFNVLEQDERRMTKALEHFTVKTVSLPDDFEKLTINVNTQEQLNQLYHGIKN